MGVKTLWSVLSSSGEMLDLRELQGCKVAIDLAGWIVQNNTCKGMAGVSRPHLRNLFFRVNALISLNIKPIFVLDGDAPELKRGTLIARQKAQSQTQTQTQSEENKSCTRRRLKGLLNECKALLDALGIESVRAEGEAEALCARLNAEGVVDAVISDDSDAFCYGAKVLLRNFKISSTGNGACVERYTIDKISQTLKLDRNRLVMMAIMLGCDFCPQGVPGCGKESITQLFELWPQSWDCIEILKLWIKKKFLPIVSIPKGKSIHYQCSKCVGDDHCEDCDEWSFAVSSWTKCHCQLLEENKHLLKLEESLKKKCAELDSNFWNNKFEKVLSEFRQSCNPTVLDRVRHFQVCCPNIDTFVALASKKLAWTEEYGLEKILPVISRWQVQSGSNSKSVISPLEILKQRTISGTVCFVVAWEWTGSRPELAPEKFETTEPNVYLENFCPTLIEAFLASKKKSKSKATKKKPVVEKQPTKAQQPITQFFKEKKEVKPKEVKPKAIKPLEIVEDEEENLPENLSFLIDDVLSYKMKRNLSLIETKNEVVTSTPVSCNPRKRLDVKKTPKASTATLVNESLEDSFDRMCKVDDKIFALKQIKTTMSK